MKITRKSTGYTSAFLWVLTALLLSGCSPKISEHHSLKSRQELPATSEVLKADYIDNDISLLGFDLDEAIFSREEKTYSL
ncbi:MAG TPA: hypothetical protein GX719_11030 [Gammaproteobacteria bacterium]|nr:hypothetical protein [Gammaproteobacteria bacterium]